MTWLTFILTATLISIILITRMAVFFKLKVRYFRLNFCRCFFFFSKHVVRWWNKLPDDCVITASVITFKINFLSFPDWWGLVVVLRLYYSCFYNHFSAELHFSVYYTPFLLFYAFSFFIFCTTSSLVSSFFIKFLFVSSLHLFHGLTCS